MTDNTDRPYKTLAEALAMANRHRALGISVSTEAIRETLTKVAQLKEEVNQARGMAEQNDQWEYIGVLEDRISTLEAALVEAEAGRLHLYKEMLRLDNLPDTDECPQCGGQVEGTYSTWYECWEADMNHDEDCPLEIAHNALGRRWTDESFAQAKQKLEDLTKLQNGAK